VDRTRITSWAVPVVAALLVVAAAGCGDSGDSGDGGSVGGDGGNGGEGAGAGGDETPDDGPQGAVPADGPAPAIDACALLDPADIEAQYPAIVPIGADEDTSSSYAAGCRWESHGGSTFIVDVMTPFPGSGVQDVMSSASPEELVPVEALGDEAFFQNASYESRLGVRVGDAYVQMTARVYGNGNGDDDDGEGNREPMAALLRLAVDRL